MMNILDRAVLRGALVIRVYRAGVLVEEFNDENMILNGAKNQLARLVGGDVAERHITHFGVGIGTAPATGDNVSLNNPLWKPVSSVAYPETGKAQFNWNLTTADANGMAITEFGLRCADGVLFARKQRAPINKANDIALAGTWTIIF